MEPNKQQPMQPADQVNPTTKQLGSIVAAHETDGPKPPAPETAAGTAGESQSPPQQPDAPTLPLPSPAPAPDSNPNPAQDAPSSQGQSDADLAQRPDVTMHPENKTIKLPVPTSVLPALVIGVLVLVLLLAVAALAFL